MAKPDLGNPQNTIEVLQKYKFNFQKKFGQNFLIDTHVLDKIIYSAEITKEDMVLEIGPGIGTMTQYLAEAAGKVIAVEIDKNLIPILADTLHEYENVQIINEDVLKLDIAKIVEEQNGGYYQSVFQPASEDTCQWLEKCGQMGSSERSDRRSNRDVRQRRKRQRRGIITGGICKTEQ